MEEKYNTSPVVWTMHSSGCEIIADNVAACSSSSEDELEALDVAWRRADWRVINVDISKWDDSSLFIVNEDGSAKYINQ